MLARPLPKAPFEGQKLLHELKAPCPDVLYEYQGKCYVPAFSAKPPPSSLEP